MKKWDELPVEIQEKMLERQEEIGGYKDPKMFKVHITGGFIFRDSEEGTKFWWDVILGDFDVFFARYPKQQVTA